MLYKIHVILVELTFNSLSNQTNKWNSKNKFIFIVSILLLDIDKHTLSYIVISEFYLFFLFFLKKKLPNKDSTITTVPDPN